MKGKELALIFDVGTQATRALVFDTAGDLVFVAKQNGELYISGGDQRAEADCESIWRDMCKVSLQAKEKTGLRFFQRCLFFCFFADMIFRVLLHLPRRPLRGTAR